MALSQYPQQARVVLHQPHATMARRIPPSAGVLEALDDARCVLACGAHQQSTLVHWLLALDVEFEVLEPPSLRDLLQAATERVARGLARGSGSMKPLP